MADDSAAGPALVPDATHRPSGTAAVVGFADADELLASMIETTHAAMEAAIAERLWRQSISDRGDAAATLFLDAERVRSLLHGPTDQAPRELAQLRLKADRRQLGLQRRLEATASHGPPVARAVQRWRLPGDAIAILIHAISIELTPRLARLAAFVAGDGSRGSVAVEAMAALLGSEERGVAMVARQLAPGAPLHDLAVVLLRAPDLPLLRRTVWLAPRVIELALGRLALDELTGAVAIVAPPAGSGPDDAARASIHAVVGHAVVGRPASTVAGVVRTGRVAALAAIARVLEDAGQQLLVTDLSNLAEDARLAAIAREAVLLDAAIAVRVDVVARDAVRAARAVDRLAALAPVFLVGSGELVPALPLTVGVVPIELSPPRHAQLAAAVAGGFPGLLTAEDVARVTATAPLDLAAVRRAAATVAAHPFPVDPVATVTRALADQLAPPEGPGLRALGTRPLPALVPVLATAVETVAERWSAGRWPRRLRILIDGRPGTGKTTVAAAIAGRLGLPAFAIDPVRAIRGDDHDPALANVMTAVVANAAVLVVENVDLLGARRGRATTDPPFTMAWLARHDGMLIVTTRDPIAHLEPSLRRELDLSISVPFPDATERLRLWQQVLARHGWPVDAAELDALARDFPFSAAQVERVAQLAGDGLGLRAEAERRSMLVAGLPSGSEVE